MSQQTIQEYISPNGTVPHMPSNMTIAQFFLDYHHPNRPVRPDTAPWLIDNDTGRSYHLEEIRTRTYSLADIMKARWNIGNDDCVAFFTPNHVEFPITAWAAHRLGAVAAAANLTDLEAAKLAGLSEDMIVVIPNDDEPVPEGFQTR